MTDRESTAAAEQVASASGEIATAPETASVAETPHASWLKSLASAAFVGTWAAAGFVHGINTPAEVSLPIGTATVSLQPGAHTSDIFHDDTIKIHSPAHATIQGVPVGASIGIGLNGVNFARPNGRTDPRLVAEFFGLLSDTSDMQHDIEAGAIEHIAWNGGIAGGVALSLVGGYFANSAWDRRRKKRLTPEQQETINAFHIPYRRAAAALVAVSIVAPTGYVGQSIYSYATVQETPIKPDPLFNDIRALKGSSISGPLAPFVEGVSSYVKTYIAENDTFYNELHDKVAEAIKSQDTTVPAGTEPVLVIADKHCNTGMDRIIKLIAKEFKVKIIISAGDDNFSGDFPFEAGCTSGLAKAGKEVGAEVAVVKGNHSSLASMVTATKQGIHVLKNKVLTLFGIRIIGGPDLRQSHFGDGHITPASPSAQEKLLDDQAKAISAAACASPNQIALEVAHDPSVSAQVMDSDCGKVTTFISGHVHKWSLTVVQKNNTTYNNLIEGSTGGAPQPGQSTGGEDAITVGPLQHEATMDILYVDPASQRVLLDRKILILPNKTVTFTDKSLVPVATSEAKSRVPK